MYFIHLLLECFVNGLTTTIVDLNRLYAAAPPEVRTKVRPVALPPEETASPTTTDTKEAEYLRKRLAAKTRPPKKVSGDGNYSDGDDERDVFSRPPPLRNISSLRS